MLYFIVTLLECEYHLVVPECWIYDMDELKLKTHGYKRNQGHLE